MGEVTVWRCCFLFLTICDVSRRGTGGYAFWGGGATAYFTTSSMCCVSEDIGLVGPSLDFSGSSLCSAQDGASPSSVLAGRRSDKRSLGNH